MKLLILFGILMTLVISTLSVPFPVSENVIKINDYLTKLFEKTINTKNPKYSRTAVLKSEQFKNAWNKYKKGNGKKFDSPKEERKHQEQFLRNIEGIVEHNRMYYSGKSTYQMGINMFSDLSPTQFMNPYARITNH